jgi:hypothetical protein
MVVRLLAVSDDTELTALHEIFQQVLGWSGQLGHAFRIHGQEFNSFRRRSRAQPLRAFRLHRQEKFLYRYDFLDLWEWDLRVLDVQEGVEQDPLPVCLGGRGAAPPEFCGGPTGYRLMLKRQREGAAMSDPGLVEAGIRRLAQACPDQPARTWGFLHIPAKRCNPGSRRQRGLGSDPDLRQFPNDFVHIHRLWLFTELVAPVQVDVLPGDRGNLLD